MSQVTDTPVRMLPADIGQLRQLSDPRVSPDGTTVAFTVTDPDLEANRYSRRIWLAPAGRADASGADATPAGGEPWPFTGPGSEYLPRWSPDGRRLAFATTDAGGRSEVCILPVAGGGERLVVCAIDGALTDWRGRRTAARSRSSRATPTPRSTARATSGPATRTCRHGGSAACSTATTETAGRSTARAGSSWSPPTDRRRPAR